jgi:hypothetical protein
MMYAYGGMCARDAIRFCGISKVLLPTAVGLLLVTMTFPDLSRTPDVTP